MLRKAAIFGSLIAVVCDAFFRISGFDQVRFLKDTGETIYSYSQQASLVSEKLSKELSFQGSTVKEDLHSSNTAALGLFDWEEECIKEGALLVRSNETIYSRNRQQTTKCQPPPDMMNDCCEGSYSSGGTIINIAHDKCAATFESSAHSNSSLQQHARKFLADMPVPSLHKTNGAVGASTNSGIDKACDICRIIEVSRENNLTIVFLGDSMQAQVFQGLIYELKRRNYSVHLTNNGTQREGFWKTTVQYRETITIKSKDWLDGGKNEGLASFITMKFFQLYIMPFDHPDEVEEVINAGDVLILGFGLHWNYNQPYYPMQSPERYTKTMADLLVSIQHNSSRTKLVIHRETSAQHFDAPAGDFAIWNDNPNPNKTNQCRPIIDRNETLSTWRESSVSLAAQQAGYHYTIVGSHMPPRLPLSSITKELVVLPYYNFTAAHWDQHPPEIADCTHYCPSPFLYLPLWRSFRIALDRQFAADISQLR